MQYASFWAKVIEKAMEVMEEIIKVMVKIIQEVMEVIVAMENVNGISNMKNTIWINS